MSIDAQLERKRVPLTKFHQSIAEYLDMALRSPIILTSHGRKRHIVADSAYFERLEEIARGNIPAPISGNKPLLRSAKDVDGDGSQN